MFHDRRPFWDLDMENGYVTYTYKNTIIKIFDKENEYIKFKILSFLYDISIELIQYWKLIQYEPPEIYPKKYQLLIENDIVNFKDGIRLFCHTPFHIMEIRKNDMFNGLNLPKGVHECRYADTDIGKDKRKRAKHRYVMLNLDSSSDGIKRLFIHELTHTLCNHVIFRENDHNDDFKAYEDMLTYVLNDTLEFSNRFDEMLKNLNSFNP